VSNASQLTSTICCLPIKVVTTNRFKPSTLLGFFVPSISQRRVIMRWISHSEAQVLAFSTPDAQPIAFRLPGHLTQDRVHLLARAVFGYRAYVERGNGTWVVQRVPFLDAHARARLEKMNRRNTQRDTHRTSRQKPHIVLRGGL
jgi:hypothetical protein